MIAVRVALISDIHGNFVALMQSCGRGIGGRNSVQFKEEKEISDVIEFSCANGDRDNGAW